MLVYSYDRLLLGNKKKRTTDACGKMHECQKHCARKAWLK